MFPTEKPLLPKSAPIFAPTPATPPPLRISTVMPEGSDTVSASCEAEGSPPAFTLSMIAFHSDDDALKTAVPSESPVLPGTHAV